MAGGEISTVSLHVLKLPMRESLVPRWNLKLDLYLFYLCTHQPQARMRNFWRQSPTYQTSSAGIPRLVIKSLLELTLTAPPSLPQGDRKPGTIFVQNLNCKPTDHTFHPFTTTMGSLRPSLMSSPPQTHLKWERCYNTARWILLRISPVTILFNPRSLFNSQAIQRAALTRTPTPHLNERR